MRFVLPLFLLAACMDYTITGGERGQADPFEPEVDPEPVILVEPMQIDFGDVRRGASESVPVTISNVGTAPFQLLQLLPPEATAIRLGAMPLEPLEPGASEQITVTWSPSSFDALTDGFGIEHTASNQGTVNVDLIGNVPAPAITIDPAHHDFGVVERRTAVDLSVTIGNAGEETLRINDLTYTTSSESGELRLHDLGVFDGLPITLPVGASAPVTIRFEPTTDMAVEGRLNVFSDDPATPEVVARQDGVGTPGRDYDLEISITADDEWQGWLNGAPLPGINRGDWQRRDTINARLPSGEHVLAIHAYDKARVVAGLIAYVKVDGDPWYPSGAADFRVSTTRPPTEWVNPDFDASAWPAASRCDTSSASVWGTYWPAPFYDVGASWIWWTPNCRSLGEGWFRLVIELP